MSSPGMTQLGPTRRSVDMAGVVCHGRRPAATYLEDRQMPAGPERPNPKSFVVTEGDQRAPNRAMLRAVGFGDGDFARPILGVANAHSTITPCNAGLGRLASAAEQAI